VLETGLQVERGGLGPFTSNIDSVCRLLPAIILYNDENVPISQFGTSYTIGDSLFRYEIITEAELDTFSVQITTNGGDAEAQKNDVNVNKIDADSWVNTMPFVHKSPSATTGDAYLQTTKADQIFIYYENPYLPDDNASLTIGVLYGPDIAQASYLDQDGDGRIETVIINFESPLQGLPDQLEFNIHDGVTLHTRTALLAGGEIAFNQSVAGANITTQIVVTLADPFPRGVTSVSPFPESYGHSFRQDDVPISEGDFPVEDLVPPVITSAVFSDPDIIDQPQKLTVTFSEPVVIDPNAVQPLIIKRDTLNLTELGLEVISITPVDGRTDKYVFELAQGTDYFAVNGDSVSININGEVTDILGTAPETLNFTAGEGKSPSQSIKSFTISPPDSQLPGVPNEAVIGNQSEFILINQDNQPLPGNSEGKCQDCYVEQDGNFVGPVFTFVIEFPVDYQFVIYDNLGRHIVTTTGKVKQEDLSSFLDVSEEGTRPKYEVRVVWDGRNENGTRVGSGAYILRAKFVFPVDPSVGTTGANKKFLRKFGYGK
jgi:hypothetical protein